MPETCVLASSSWRWMALRLSAGERRVVQPIHINQIQSHVRAHCTHIQTHSCSVTLTRARRRPLNIRSIGAHSATAHPFQSLHMCRIRHPSLGTAPLLFRSRLLSTYTATLPDTRVSHNQSTVQIPSEKRVPLQLFCALVFVQSWLIFCRSLARFDCCHSPSRKLMLVNIV